MRLQEFIRYILDCNPKQLPNASFFFTANNRYTDCKDESVIDVCSIYRFMKANNHSQPPPPYHKESFPFTRKDLVKCLVRIAHNHETPFTLRLRCCEQLTDITLSKRVLQHALTLPVKEIIALGIEDRHWLNHYIKHFIPNFKILQNEVTTMFTDYVTKNTIARGLSIYKSIQTIFNVLPQTLAGVSMTYKIIENRVEPDLQKAGIDAYFYNNQNQMRNYLVPTLQLYNQKGWLLPDHCRIAQELVQGDEDMIGDLADFFMTLYGIQFNEFRRWGQQHIRGNRVAGGIFTGKQSVHQLDQNRSKFLTWLATQSLHFQPDLLKVLDETQLSKDELEKLVKNKKYSSMKLKLFQKIEHVTFGTTIKRSLERMHTDNTDLKTADGKHVWKLSDLFERICFVIANHESHEALTERLIEELEEMSNTCFSGHVNRIFNVFTGFEEDLVTVDANLEIILSIKVNLQNVIDEANEKDQDTILELLGTTEEWPQDVVEYIKTKTLDIKNEMFKLYDKIITENEFNTLFTTEVNKYFGTIIHS